MASKGTAGEGDVGSSLLLNQPVVIDNGTSTLKAGFAGSSKPKVFLLLLQIFAMKAFLLQSNGILALVLVPVTSVISYYFRSSLEQRSEEQNI
jgi:actin-related protein